eukprot:superscaffoldBa00003427_g16918
MLQEVIDALNQASEDSDEDYDNRDFLQDPEIEVGAEVEVDMEARQNVGEEEEQEEPLPDEDGVEEIRDENVIDGALPGGSRKRGREEDSEDEESSSRCLRCDCVFNYNNDAQNQTQFGAQEERDKDVINDPLSAREEEDEEEEESSDNYTCDFPDSDVNSVDYSESDTD